MSAINFGEILSGGFKTWKKNITICVPFILGAVISIVVAACILLPTMFSLFSPVIKQAISNPASMSSPETASQIFRIISENIGLIIGVTMVLVILLALIMSFFTAGAIGMAKEAILTGSTNFSHMMTYGKKKFLSYFGASVIVCLIMSVGILFALPGLIDLFANIGSLSSTPTAQEALAIMGPLMMGGLLMVVYILLMSIILALIPYAVVLDDLKAIEGFFKGIRVFWHYNKLNVFLMWLIVLVISIILSLFGMIPYAGGIIVLILSFFVVTPMITIWWTKLYLTITKKDREATSPINVQ
jgi:hypothetical protein